MTAWMVLLLTLVSCASGKAPTAGLDQHERKWTDRRTESYSYELKVLCFCPTELTSPVIIEVRKGEPAQVRYTADGALAPSTYFDKYDSMEELFAVLREARSRQADEIIVRYDEQYGFPATVRIDYVQNAVDDELAFEVSGFRVLK
jgi:hypothetical protein